MINTTGSEAAVVSGGPLHDNKYIFEQIHFHWGESDTKGSEDYINNHSFAMELHAVFYKQDYKSMTEAVKHPDGLAVFAYFYEVRMLCILMKLYSIIMLYVLIFYTGSR